MAAVRFLPLPIGWRSTFPAVRRAFPGIRVGLIEPYPVFTPAQFADMLRLLHDRGTGVDFLHIDAWQPDTSPAREAYGRDMIQLSDLAAQYKIPFGVIIWGADGDADTTYSTYALSNATALAHTFRGWDVTPAARDHPELGALEHRPVHQPVESA